MKIGISTWACTWAIGVVGFERPQSPMNAMAVVERAHALGAEVVQFADNLAASPDELIDAATRARELGIVVETGFAGTDRATLENAIALTIECGAHMFRTLPHRGADVPTPDVLTARLREIRPLLEAEGITLALENHDHYRAHELRDAVLAANSDRIGICLDTVNNYGTGESWRETASLLADLTVNFHVKDFTISRIPQQTGFRIDGAPVGRGLLDLSACVGLIPPQANWIIEQWTPWQGTIESAIALEQSWLEESMAALLTLRTKQ